MAVANTGFSSINQLNRQLRVGGIKQLLDPKVAVSRGMSQKKAHGLTQTYVLSLPTEANIDEVIKRYQADPNVEYAEPNYIYKAILVPNDPFYSNQYALPKISAPQAWDIQTGSASIVIAVIDTGIDTAHPDLAANIWMNPGEVAANGIDDDGNGYIDDIRGWNFDSNNANSKDDHGHGTHCAGIAGARGNNNLGIAGVSWNCRLMVVKGLDVFGSGSLENLANCIIYATDMGAKVLSNSWGGGGPSITMENAINYATSQGVLVVFAAGNDNLEIPAYPAYYSNAVAVASTNNLDYKSGFSNYGIWVDVSAPGSSIYSTLPTYAVTLSGTHYGYLSGTSMACPAVAGLAGLLFSQNSSLTNTEVRALIEEGVNNIDALNPTYTGKLGTGRINAYNSFNLSASSSTISGTIRSDDDAPLDNVMVSLISASLIKKSTTTNALGVYHFTAFGNQTYTMAPFKQGWDFVPLNRVYDPLIENQANQNFIGSLALFSPTTSILTPINNATLANQVTVSGIADDDKSLEKVEVQIDSAPWVSANGLSTWDYVFNTTDFTNGTHTIRARATDGAGLTAISAITVSIQNIGVATYDAIRKAPACLTNESRCDSGPILVDGRGLMFAGIEMNHPNTINNSCADGNYGTYHVDESVDRIKIRTLDGSLLAPGKSVEVEVVVWAFSTTQDFLDLYYTNNANNPDWSFLRTISPLVSGKNVLKSTFTLSSGSLQAFRANFRYGGSASICPFGFFNDHDDLVFATGDVDIIPPTIVLSSPTSNQTLSDAVTVLGTAADNDGVARVEVMIDQGGYRLANGTSAWTYLLDTTVLNNGTHTITAQAIDSSGNTASTSIVVNVFNPGLAVYDVSLKVPACLSEGNLCFSGQLLVGRDTISNGNEPHQPNTLFDSCPDGTYGLFHVDESIDLFKISTLDGTVLAPGKEVMVEATVWAFSSTSLDFLDIYYATDALNPQWSLIGTMSAPASGLQKLTKSFLLLPGSIQALRGVFRYTGSVSSCTIGQYNDHDDLVFKVASPPTIVIQTPIPGADVSNIVNVQGTASDTSGVSKVEIKIDTGPYVVAQGTGSWSWSFDGKTLSEGSHTITAQATNNVGLTSSTSIVVNVLHTHAVYSSLWQAPLCDSIQGECDTRGLLLSRGQITGRVEKHAPNTLRDSCLDGNSGAYQVNESLDRLIVSARTSDYFAAGKSVRVKSVVWAGGDYSADRLEIYSAADANSPNWVFVASATPLGAGKQIISRNFTLPVGSLQAIRAVFRSGDGGVLGSPCSPGFSTDHDDLVFRVSMPPQVVITAPVPDTTVSGIVLVRGTAVDDLGISKVEVKVDNKPHSLATGTTSWTFALDTALYSNGPHNLVARVTDQSGLVGIHVVKVHVNNSSAEEYDPGLLYPITSPVAAGIPAASRSLAVVSGSSGLGEVYSFPNPAKNPTFHVEVGGSPDSLSLVVFDAAGNQVHGAHLSLDTRIPRQGKEAIEYQWNTDGASSGVYSYVVILEEDGRRTSLKKNLVLIK